ncbi:MAG: hypothetical protein CFE24_04300 [Flavobacterium sp. BFFFF2]|nr:MAG: hypothetical protein CFE24_04300 [Flavobacterium sp. BFFFF2]
MMAKNVLSKKWLYLLTTICIINGLFAQTKKGKPASNQPNAYEIKIDLKNCKDTLVYLTYYQFDKTMLKDTCKNIKDGKIVFKGKTKLDTGVYSLISQKKSIYFDFFIDDQHQFLDLSSDSSDEFIKDLKAKNSDQHNAFFEYVKFLGGKNMEFAQFKEKSKGMSKKDSTALVQPKQKEINELINDYEQQFYEKQKGSYLGDVMNLKIEKVLKNIPKASNGRPDSILSYRYYKDHYWDHVNFKDDAIVRNPFFQGKLKKYFDNVLVRHPDSVAVEIDKMIDKTVQSSLVNKLLIANFTSNYEISKMMGFDKVFVHMVDKYFKTGKAKGIYVDDGIIDKIIKRANLLRPILVGEKAPDLAMIDINDYPKIAKMGFEKAKTSEEVTKVFYDNYQEINKTFTHLNDVQADYTLLVFWDVDCSHCKVEIPKLLELYHKLLAENKNVKAFCVYTQYDYDKYKKYIEEKKLDWINVFDAVHFNNLRDKYDIVSTPVIYVLDKNKVIKAKRIDVEQISDVLKFIELEAKAKAKK